MASDNAVSVPAYPAHLAAAPPYSSYSASSAGYASSNRPAPSAVHSRNETDRTHRTPLAGSRPGTRNQPAASAGSSQTRPVLRMTTPKAPLRSSETAPRYRADYAARTSNHRLQTGTPLPPPANNYFTMVESFST